MTSMDGRESRELAGRMLRAVHAAGSPHLPASVRLLESYGRFVRRLRRRGVVAPNGTANGIVARSRSVSPLRLLVMWVLANHVWARISSAPDPWTVLHTEARFWESELRERVRPRDLQRAGRSLKRELDRIEGTRYGSTACRR